MTLYNPNVPTNLDDYYADSQPQLLNNFTKLFNVFTRNHTNINGANAGFHSKLDFFEQPQGFQTGVGEISVYCKNVDGQTDQIFLRYQGDGQEVQITNYQIYSLQATPQQEAYFTFLPGKVLAYFGKMLIAKGSTIINLNPPVAKNIITVQVTSLGTGANFNSPVEVNMTNGIATGITLGSVFNTVPQSYLVLANI